MYCSFSPSKDVGIPITYIIYNKNIETADDDVRTQCVVAPY